MYCKNNRISVRATVSKKKSIAVGLSIFVVIALVMGIVVGMLFRADYRYTDKGDYIVIDKYVGSSSEIEVPSIMKGKPVKEVSARAFSGCMKLIRIDIPECVTTFGEYAFSGCENLTEIILPDSITDFPEGLFLGCKSLQSMKIPKNVTTIGNLAFSDCPALEELTIPESVINIGQQFISGSQMVICCSADSYAETWATENGHTCAYTITISSEAMTPTLKSGEIISVFHINEDYETGDIIAFQVKDFGTEYLFSRVIATEGQTVDIDYEKDIVYVDGLALNETYTSGSTRTISEFIGPIIVPAHHVFVLGDNRNAAIDSRAAMVGTIEVGCILGRIKND